MDNQDLKKLAALIRYFILKITHQAQSGHPTSCFSAVELATMLYFKYLHYDLDNPKNPANDRVIFSKGHASALFYSLYAAAGKLTEEELMGYRTFESVLEGHPTKRFPFTEAATGSLGQGLAVGAGEALALALRSRKNFDPSSVSLQPTHNQSPHEKMNPDKIFSLPAPPRVFVLLGDGEMAEGQVWEAAAWASFHKLNNLIAIVDVNRLGQSQETMHGHDVEMYRRKFEAFGWGVIVIDGHNFSEIDAAFQKAADYKAGPVAIIAKTIKGKGIAYWEDKEGWHNKMLPGEEYKKALAIFGAVDKTIRGIIQKPILAGNAEVGMPLSPHPSNPSASAPSPSPIKDMTVLEKARLPALPIYSGGVATKKAFGNALERLGEVYSNLIVLDGDVANSTHTDQFAKKYPDRFLQMYIAEQNMVSVATGLARRGFLPFVSTFACFLSRAHDQIRMAPLSGVTLLVNGSYAGVSMGKDGPSQMGLEDIALFRSIIGSTVLYPSDPYQTERLVEEMLKAQGVVYIRTTREPTPVIYGPDDIFVIGGSKTFSTQITKLNDQITVVAAGITLHEALKAQQQLAQEQIGIRVIDCYSIKPIDAPALKKAAEETKAIIIVEDHYPEGGLGEAVESAILDNCRVPIIHLAVRKLPRSGTPQELLAFEEIDADAIIKAVKTFCHSREGGNP